ncbi:MAG: chorismate mutase [Candidatus Nanopelagicaceae bacterium]|nr:chorismate mutase [Candidatus Nanopelagicaceae bacterium]
MSLRAIRGAIQIDVDSQQEMRSAVIELMTTLMSKNDLTAEDLVSVIFTCTPDLVSDFPAASAREMGLGAVPLLCAVEMNVPGSLPRTIRTLVHCQSQLAREQISHVYLRGAVALRRDIAQ